MNNFLDNLIDRIDGCFYYGSRVSEYDWDAIKMHINTLQQTIKTLEDELKIE